MDGTLFDSAILVLKCLCVLAIGPVAIAAACYFRARSTEPNWTEEGNAK